MAWFARLLDNNGRYGLCPADQISTVMELSEGRVLACLITRHATSVCKTMHDYGRTATTLKTTG